MNAYFTLACFTRIELSSAAEKLKSHVYTHCRTKDQKFSVGTHITNKSRLNKNLHLSYFYIRNNRRNNNEELFSDLCSDGLFV